MNEAIGLRARKKERTRQAISDAAIALFLARGYDQVVVAEVAAAAEVSKPTLFRYFPTKEDLVLHRFADHQGEWARVVAERAPDEPPLAALHRHLVRGLHERDPVTGLNDVREVLAFHGLVFGTPSLCAHLVHYRAADEAALAEALRAAAGAGPDELGPRLAAAQLTAVREVLARENWRRLTAGHTADQLLPQAEAAADRAFELLATGLAGRWA
ncbi:TetR/AcrR family transcriptional regulator [Kitasatospora sp. NPDC052896]|uniref:TetR/AcrR family transcriptional regulator n=1 Tax=Kitasatospora sp. NPDC052896 TaxID=3364061 RepID=UPI0037C53FE0